MNRMNDMKTNLKLMYELSHKNSWGRNKILKLNIDDKLQLKLSANCVTPNVSCGEAMLTLLVCDNMEYSFDIETLVKLFYSIDENLTKDFVVSCCESTNIPKRLLEIFYSKLRAKNSKRHLKEKLMLSYVEYYTTK